MNALVVVLALLAIAWVVVWRARRWTSSTASRNRASTATRSTSFSRCWPTKTLAEQLRLELLPHAPDLHEESAEAILNAVSGLPDGARRRVAAVLADGYRVLQTEQL